jgi:metallo-beta-lactamase family protein
MARQGKIIIPSFTLERTQEVVYFLNELLQEKAIASLPIYVDSPLATDITNTFKYHSAYFNQEARQASSGGRSPFESAHVTYIRDQRQSKSLNHDHRPMVIIAGSGMCEAGRILHHLKNNIEDSRNTILVVGYMAKDTLGRRIVEKNRYVRIFGAEYELNAEVAVINALSGHADKNELLDFAKRCLPLKRIFLVHGDEDQTQKLAEALAASGLNVHAPFKDEEVSLL